MMSPAVTGPIPSIVSRSSTVAVPRLIGPSVAADDDAAAVVDPLGAFSGTTTCWPSASGAARLIAFGSASAVGPPARSTASVTREPEAKRYTPGRPTAPATWTTASPPRWTSNEPASPADDDSAASPLDAPASAERTQRAPTSSSATAIAP